MKALQAFEKKNFSPLPLLQKFKSLETRDQDVGGSNPLSPVNQSTS
jgi:hypothetical protein